MLNSNHSVFEDFYFTFFIQVIFEGSFLNWKTYFWRPKLIVSFNLWKNCKAKALKCIWYKCQRTNTRIWLLKKNGWKMHFGVLRMYLHSFVFRIWTLGPLEIKVIIQIKKLNYSLSMRLVSSTLIHRVRRLFWRGLKPTQNYDF